MYEHHYSVVTDLPKQAQYLLDLPPLSTVVAQGRFFPLGPLVRACLSQSYRCHAMVEKRPPVQNRYHNCSIYSNRKKTLLLLCLQILQKNPERKTLQLHPSVNTFGYYVCKLHFSHKNVWHKFLHSTF